MILDSERCYLLHGLSLFLLFHLNYVLNSHICKMVDPKHSTLGMTLMHPFFIIEILNLDLFYNDSKVFT